MAVIFYAGHGMEVGGENGLIPVDAELRSDTDVENEAISLRTVSYQVAKARQLGLVILDACRNNPFAAKMARSLRTRAVTRGLAPTEPTDNVLVAFAAKDGTLANDGDGRNSPFTTALLHNIETPGLEISFLFRNVRDEVMAATKREQQPFVYGSLSKEAIYLKSSTAGLDVPVSQLPQSISANVSGLGVSDQPKTYFQPEDAKHVAEIAKRLGLDMPEFSVAAVDPKVPAEFRRLVGVWASKVGYNGGTGRQGMLIVNSVDAEGLVTGYYMWGAPTKTSFTQNLAGYLNFSGKAQGGQLVFTVGPVRRTVFFSSGGKIRVQDDWKDGRSATITEEPIWTLAEQELVARAR